MPPRLAVFWLSLALAALKGINGAGFKSTTRQAITTSSSAYEHARAEIAAEANTGGIPTSHPRDVPGGSGAVVTAGGTAVPPPPCTQAAAAAACVGKPAIDKFYTEPRTACTCFYRCHCTGCPALYFCQQGLKFNEKVQACDWPANVPQCDRPSPPSPPKPPKPPSPPPRPPPSPPKPPRPPLPPAPPRPPPAPPGSRYRFAGYYESWGDPWAGKARDSALAKLPSYVNIVCLSFMWPEASYRGGLTWEGTGLSFSSEPWVVKGAIAMLKRRNPRTKVLVSVGGATYPRWEALNATSVATFVKFFGLDGVDVDFEGGASCWKEGTRMRCTSDEMYIKSVKAIRASLPRPYIVTTAAWSIGAYGEWRYANSKPQGSHTGMSLNMLRAVGSMLDYVFVMSYDAGDKVSPHGAPTGYDPKEAINAYCARFPCNRVLAGMQVPPESWGEAEITVAEATDLGRWVARRGAGGLMLWSLTKQGRPSPQQLSKAACTSLGMFGCSAPLPG